MDSEKPCDARKNPLVVHVDEPVERVHEQHDGGTVLRKPNVVYQANAQAEGLGAPVNIKVVVPPSTAPSALEHDLVLLDEIDKIVGAHSAQNNNSTRTQLWNNVFSCALTTAACGFCLFIVLGFIALMYDMTQSYWAEYNHGERSFWITFGFWTGSLLLLFSTVTCLLSTERVYNCISCTKRQQSIWSDHRFRAAIFLLIFVLFAPVCATMASILARDDIFIGARRPENFAAVDFVGRFVAVYTWVLLSAFAYFVLWKLPYWMIDYTRGAKTTPELKQLAQPATVKASRDSVDLSASHGTADSAVVNDLVYNDDSIRDNDATGAVSSSQQESNARVVKEIYNSVCVSGILLWILPLLASGCYSHVQCDSNCDHGTCSLLSGTCSACEDGYVGEFCQYAPAYRFDNCRVASHCGLYVRVESTMYGDLELDQVSLDEWTSSQRFAAADKIVTKYDESADAGCGTGIR